LKIEQVRNDGGDSVAQALCVHIDVTSSPLLYVPFSHGKGSAGNGALQDPNIEFTIFFFLTNIITCITAHETD
jgi:hypothetical protein